MVLNGLIPIDTQVSTGQSLKAASGRLLHNGVIRGDFKSATEISYGLIASPKSFHHFPRFCVSSILSMCSKIALRSASMHCARSAG